ncbi:MAG: LysM peptidoglycan-binding domain-containing protein [Anaerolineae bacterium]|nr:LysM peptidoglycan-binding domain-containing protein [Anaerolineae bacterium]
MPRSHFLAVAFLAFLAVLLVCAIGGAVLAQDATPSPDEPQTYVIQPGDTLLTIARRFNTTVTALVQENNIANAERIYWGQRIRIPAAQPPTATESSTTGAATATNPPEAATQEAATVAVTVSPEMPTVTPMPGLTLSEPITLFGYGIEANLIEQDTSVLLADIEELGVDWVKQIVYWRDLEPVQGEPDFTTLDPIVDALESQGVHILLTVTAAPDWARSIQEEDGPPDDFADFRTFMDTLASHYAGRVAAYEIWNEPNIRNRWKSTVHPINPTSYVDLLRQGYEAVKAADPSALVISAGLAVTGFNDALNSQAGELAVNAIDDRIFLAGMYASGLADVSDAVGVHPIGWANPPDARCCEPAEGVTTHYESPGFYFLQTLEDYRQIQIDNGDFESGLWPTRFAWGTSEDLGPPDPANIFTSYTDLLEQARYTARAYEIGIQSGYVGPMFVYNLNGCQAPGRDGFSSCYYSFLGPGGSPRPVFGAVQLIDKGVRAMPVTPTPLAAGPEATQPVEATSEATAEISP